MSPRCACPVIDRGECRQRRHGSAAVEIEVELGLYEPCPCHCHQAFEREPGEEG